MTMYPESLIGPLKTASITLVENVPAYGRCALSANFGDRNKLTKIRVADANRGGVVAFIPAYFASMKTNTNPAQRELRMAACFFLLLVLVVDLFMDHTVKGLSGKE